MNCKNFFSRLYKWPKIFLVGGYQELWYFYLSKDLLESKYIYINGLEVFYQNN